MTMLRPPGKPTHIMLIEVCGFVIVRFSVNEKLQQMNGIELRNKKKDNAIKPTRNRPKAWQIRFWTVKQKSLRPDRLVWRNNHSNCLLEQQHKRHRKPLLLVARLLKWKGSLKMKKTSIVRRNVHSFLSNLILLQLQRLLRMRNVIKLFVNWRQRFLPRK